MICVEGELLLKSAASTINIKKDGAQLICLITGWPKPFTPRTAAKHLLPKEIALEPVTIYFNDRRLGVLSEGRLSKLNFWTGFIVFYEFIKSRIKP